MCRICNRYTHCDECTLRHREFHVPAALSRTWLRGEDDMLRADVNAERRRYVESSPFSLLGSAKDDLEEAGAPTGCRSDSGPSAVAPAEAAAAAPADAADVTGDSDDPTGSFDGNRPKITYSNLHDVPASCKRRELRSLTSDK